MRFDKSLKLLNYAKNNNGNLELYTELDHSFIVGDKIFIIGGHYDNVSDLIFTTLYTTLIPNFSNPFIINKTGYTIISVNNTNNSFVIDYPVTDITLIYPYGTNNNKYGNPQDAIFKSYNTYTGDDLYKNIYVSRTCFLNGTFRKGTINNGIFGTDHHKVILNKHQNWANTANISDLTINHIVSKKVHISKGTINSKTDISNPITKKLSVTEDLTVSPTNPHTLNIVNVTNNNNGYGYSSFEELRQFDNVIINNGIFHNPYNQKISFNNLVTFNKAQIGDLEPMFQDGNYLENITLKSGSIYCVSSSSDLINIKNSTFNNLIPLYGTYMEWGVNPNEIIFHVDYNVLANKKWEIGSNVYISGIKKNNPLIVGVYISQFHDLNKALVGTITDVSYTFGDTTSAQITIEFPMLAPIWATLILEPDSLYDIENMKLSFIDYKIDKLTIENSTISGYFESSTKDVYFKNVNTFKEGYLENIIFTDNTQFLGISYANNIYISNILQYPIYTTLPDIYFTYINNENKWLKGNINNCEIIAGIIYDSEISYTLADPSDSDTTIYLNNVILNEGSRIESDVIWNNVSINFFGDTVLGTSIYTKSYLGDRKTPWKTEYFNTAPLLSLEYSTELNKTEGVKALDLAYYTSRQIINDVTTTTDAPLYELTYQAPIVDGTMSVYNDNLKAVIIDRGNMKYVNGFGWNVSNPYERVLFADKLSNNTIVSDALLNRLNQNEIPLVTYFPGFALPPSNAVQPVEVDDNYVVPDVPYIYPNYPNTLNDTFINVYHIYDKPDIFPDSSMNDPLTDMFLKLDPSMGPIIDNIYHDTVTPTAIPDSVNTLYFRQPGAYLSAGSVTNVPACFIEIEQVIIFTKNLSDVVTDIDIINCNYCVPYSTYINGQEYAWDLYPDINLYPTDFVIKDAGGNNVQFETSFKTKTEIHVEFWVTWFHNDSGLSPMSSENNPYLQRKHISGERTKHVIEHTFESSGETFYMVDDSGDNLIDDSGDNIIWI